MPFWVYGLTNPFSLFFYYVIFEIVLKVVLGIKHIQWRFNFKWRLLIYFILILISIAMNYKILFTNDYRKSLVDASPIAELSSEQVNRLEGVLEKFKDYDFIIQCDIEEMENHPFLSKTCYMIWHRNKPFGGLLINIHFYNYEQDAIEERQLRLQENRFAPTNVLERRYTRIINDNNTEIILFDSKMDRAGHLVPVSNRNLRSEIRLGNAVISLSESPEQHQLNKNISSDFIKLLCELLAE